MPKVKSTFGKLILAKELDPTKLNLLSSPSMSILTLSILSAVGLMVLFKYSFALT